MSRFLALLAAFHLLSSVTLAVETTIESRIDEYARPLEKSGYLSGCLAVSHAGRPVAERCFGVADAERKVPIVPSTRLCIASLSKPMTVVAILRLVEQEKLGLDDPVSRWVESFPSGDSITLTDLLTHRAGIAHRVTEPEEEEKPLAPADIVQRIREKGLAYPPHSRSQYSSAGYAVLAYVIERATGKSFGDAMRELVFDPLGMKDTAHPDGREIRQRATSFVAGPEGPVPAPPKDYGFLAGGGSLYSTAADVLRFGQAYLDKKLLTENGWSSFHELGWATEDAVRWSGSTNGFGSWLDIDQAARNVRVFLGNAGTGGANILRTAAPALVAGEPPPPRPEVPPRVRLAPGRLPGLTGSYARGGGAPLVVTVESGVLHMGSDVVVPVALDRFFNPTYFSEAQFERDENGVGKTIRITAPGLDEPLVFERVQ